MRSRLANRRECSRLTFVHGGTQYHAALSCAADGNLVEVFLSASAKSGTAIDSIARDLAVTASIALQHGATASELRHALTRGDDGAAAGPLGKLLDLLAAEIEAS